MPDRNAGTELVGQFFFETAHVRIGWLFRLLRSAGSQAFHEPFGFAYREPKSDDFVGCCRLRCHWQGQQRSGMAHLQLSYFDEILHLLVQFEQTHQVGDRRSRTTYRFGRFLVGQTELFGQPRQSARLLERVQVFALDVFDQRHRDSRFVRHIAHQRGNRLQSRQLCGPPATLAGDDFVFSLAAVMCRPHQERLHDALSPYRIRKVFEGFLADVQAWLVAAFFQQIDPDITHVTARRHRGFGHSRAQQCVQTLAQSPAFRRHR